MKPTKETKPPTVVAINTCGECPFNLDTSDSLYPQPVNTCTVDEYGDVSAAKKTSTKSLPDDCPLALTSILLIYETDRGAGGFGSTGLWGC